MELLSWWADADWIVRGVFIILLGLSLMSWTIMIHKTLQIRAAIHGERSFFDKSKPQGHLPSAHVLAELSGIAADRETVASAVLRESRVDYESGMTTLATIGNTAPFIGLFGTVWGIMHALQGLSGAEALSMDMIAGPVAEALVATAAGLFTAIPAVAGYNLLLRQLRLLFAIAETNTVKLLINRNGGN